MVHARKIILIIEPVFQLCSRDVTPIWSSTLINCMLKRLTSVGLVMEDHYTFVHAFMARYNESIKFLQELALALEDGYSPNHDINLSYLFTNLAYGNVMESTFYAPHLKGSLF